MQGHFYEGDTADQSVDRMPFRHLAEVFAPELARRQYFPARDVKSADLLLVVHWGTTQPRPSLLEMTGRTSPRLDTSASDADRQLRIDRASGGNDPVAGLMAELANDGARLQQEDALAQIADHVAIDQSSANLAQLLGYTRELRQLAAGQGTTADEYTLRSDLKQERYFIILRAYDLRQTAPPDGPRRPVWTLHLNMSSPGNNFTGAIARMSAAAVDFVGRTTDHVATVRPRVREGRVEVGPLTIVNEQEPAKK
jgi:hypothetical protein